jgi:predicted outer membrane repeat protein
VYPGTYPGNINFRGKAITVRSSDGPEETIIDAQGEGPVVTFETAEKDDSVLEGFTITNGSAVSEEENIEHGGGIRMLSAGPTIRDCILLENHADGDGGGMYCFSTGSNPKIENVVFQGNTAGGEGGALSAVYGGPDLVDSLFFDNEADRGGAISARYWGTLTLTGCTLADNSAADGWALYLRHAGVEISESIVWSGSASGEPIVMDLDDGPNPPLPANTTLALSYLLLQGETANVTDSVQGTETCSSHPDRCCIVNNDQVCIVDEDELEGILDPREDPFFASRSQEDPKQAFYLSQTAAGQSETSPCVDAGDRTAVEAGLDEGTTRTDGAADQGNVDLGYHYAIDGS